MNSYRAVYLQHGDANGPFTTVSVAFRYNRSTAGPFKRGPFASHWQVRHNNRWLRVMCADSAPHAYVTINRKRVPVTFEKHDAVFVMVSTEQVQP